MIRALTAITIVVLIAVPVSGESPEIGPQPREHKPQWQRLLVGDDAKHAASLEKRLLEARIAGKLVDELSVAKELLSFRTRVQGLDHWQVVNARLAVTDAEKQFTDDERVQLSQAMEQTRRLIQFNREGRYREATELAQKALVTRRNILGDHNRATLDSATSLGILLLTQARYEESAQLFERTLLFRKELLGNNHPDTANSCSNLAVLRQAQGSFSDAESLLRDALRIGRETLGNSDSSVVTLTNNLAALCKRQAKYQEAERVFQEALRMGVQISGERHVNTAPILHNLAELYRDMGRYQDAEYLVRAALEILTEAHGRLHIDTASAKKNLGEILRLQGRFTEAQPVLQDAISIWNDKLGEQHPATLAGLCSLGLLYRNLGRDAEAEQLCRVVLRRSQDALGERHPLTLTAMNNLADVCSDKEMFAEAVMLHQKALARARDELGEQHPDTTNSMNNLALAYLKQGHAADALSLFRNALKIEREILGEWHPNVALLHINIAMAVEAGGSRDEAEDCYKEALRIRKQCLGLRHPSSARAYSSFALSLHARGKYEDALNNYEQAARSFEASRLTHACNLERSAGNESNNPYVALASLSARLGKSVEAYRAAESDLGRGFLDMRSARRGGSDANAQDGGRYTIANSIAAIEARVTKLLTQEKRTAAESQELAVITTSLREKEDEIAAIAASFSKREVADLVDIQKSLGPAEAILLWIDLKTADGKLEERWACVLRPDGPPRWELVPAIEDINQPSKDSDAVLNRFRQEVSRSSGTVSIAELARKLRAQRIDPILKHLSGIERLYVVAARNMAGVPVELIAPEFTVSYIPSGTFLARRAKPLDKSTSLLALGDPVFPKQKEQKAPTALPSGGLLITQIVPDSAAAKARLQPGDVLVSYAGVKLESGEQLGKLITEKANEKTVPIEFWREADDKIGTRDVASGRLGVVLAKESAREAITARRQSDALFAKLNRGGDWDELPGTQVEVSGLEKLLGTEVKSLTRSDASEQTLDAMRKSGELKKYRYIHLASHGEGNSVAAFESKLILSQDRPRETISKPGEPLLDNQLTAREVLDHWKLEADLVTLSACETAVGKSAGGDGLLGFAQAFLLAGARSVCLSLWKVDDTATALLMDRFYRNLLGKREDGAKPMGKAAALHEAKNWLKNLSLKEATDRLGVITDGVSRGPKKGRNVIGDPPATKDGDKPYAHPKYWAAFILIGDPD